ncbi:MAG: response regulator [Deltaproteobacteria bacterium]|nr:response regulator [Deltaproteobacteria bacterium]
MIPNRVAVVEDESVIAEVLEYNLKRAGYEVDIYERGDVAWDGLRQSPPSLVVLDLMLPGIDGLDLARLLKQEKSTSKIPLIMLTAKGEEVDRIVGLELGADDYIPKPFSPREVVLRIKAVLRRASSNQTDLEEAEEETNWLEAGALRLDPAGFRVLLGDAEVSLTATEFRLLHSLMKGRGRTQTRGQLLSEVWGYADEVESRTVDTHIRRLRKKLGPESDRLETVIGLGYRLSMKG